MPMYTWKSSCCGEEVQVIRKVADIEVPPQPDEAKCKCEAPRWERRLCAPKFQLLGEGFHVNDYGPNGPRR